MGRNAAQWTKAGFRTARTRSGLACLKLPSRRLRGYQTIHCVEAICSIAGRSGIHCLRRIFLPSSDEVAGRNSEQGYDTNLKGHDPRPDESYEQHSNDNKRSDTVSKKAAQFERYYIFGIIIHDV
ncbi:hypothetical protein [Pseudomonas lopnurensis]|uniref:hypothetical protein n=1 Tax=Pseudomonas lopnurensis TaxID=1477517 RepID=UPI003F689BE8